MATTEAGRLLTTVQHRAQLTLRAAALNDLLRLWPTWRFEQDESGSLDIDLLERTWEPFMTGLMAVLERYHAESARQAAAYYTTLRTVEGAAGSYAPELARFDRDAAVRGLVLLGPIMTKKAIAARRPKLKETALVRITGVVTAAILHGHRETIARAQSADPGARGFRRVITGTCQFCRDLAAKGASVGDFQAHSNCACVPEPAFGEARPGVPQGEVWRGAEMLSDGRIDMSDGTLVMRSVDATGAAYAPLTDEMVDAMNRLPEAMHHNLPVQSVRFVDSGGLRRFDGSIDRAAAGAHDAAGVQIRMDAPFRSSMYDTLVHELSHGMDPADKLGWYNPATGTGGKVAYAQRALAAKAQIRELVESGMESMDDAARGHFAYPEMEMFSGRIDSAVDEFWAEALRFHFTDPDVLDGVPGLRQTMAEVVELWQKG